MSLLQHVLWIGKSRLYRLNGQWPITRVMKVMESHGWVPEEMSVLELFGGTGGVHLFNYINRAGSIVAWEIDPEAVEVLKKNLPKIEAHQADTYAAIHTETQTYDWIISDNPMREHGGHFEHFDLFPGLAKRAKDEAVLIFSIIPHASPFYQKRYPGLFSPEHMKARAAFYGTSHPEHLTPEDFHAAFSRHLENEGRTIKWWHVEPRNPLLSYFVCGITAQDTKDK